MFEQFWIWFSRLLVEATNTNNNKKNNNDESKPTSRSVQDFVKQISQAKGGVVTMQVGSKDYLAESLQNEFADAAIDRFCDLPAVLDKWHQQGLAAVAPPPTTTTTTQPLSSTLDDDDNVDANDAPSNNVLQVFYPSTTPEQSTPRAKFCVHCGAQLPTEARFCSSCGKPQPTL